MLPCSPLLCIVALVGIYTLAANYQCEGCNAGFTYMHALGDSVSSDELSFIAAGVIQEADIAKTQKLTYTEFEYVISRAPDFVDLFHVTI